MLQFSEAWLNRILDSTETSNFDKRLAVSESCVGLWELFKLLEGDSFAETETADRETRNLRIGDSFVRFLDRTLDAVGGPYSMLSVLDAEKWDVIRKGFMQEESEQDEKSEADDRLVTCDK